MLTFKINTGNLECVSLPSLHRFPFFIMPSAASIVSSSVCLGFSIASIISSLSDTELRPIIKSESLL